MSKPLVWSWTSVNEATKCLRQWYAVRERRMYRDDSSPALVNGRKVHEEMAAFMLGTGGLSEERQWVMPFVEKFRNLTPKPLIEHQLALDDEFRPVGGWSPRVRIRAVYDVLWRSPSGALIVDWKTGKRKDPPPEQLLLFSALLFRMPNPPPKVKSFFVWLDAEKIDSFEYGPKEAEDFLARIETFPLARMRELSGVQKDLDDVEPTPDFHCRFCPVLSCRFNKRS